MSRYPRTVLGTVCLPWSSDGTLDEALFRRTIGNLVRNGLPDLYVFGTAGEGYAVTDSMFRRVALVFADAMREGDELISSMKPDVEHWFLDTIATDPDHFGKGLGGRILDHDLAIRDAAGDACALDTHTPDNIAFYSRRGFEVIGPTIRDGAIVYGEVASSADMPRQRMRGIGMERRRNESGW